MIAWLKKINYQNVSEGIATLLADIDRIDDVLKDPEWMNSPYIISKLKLDKTIKLQQIDRLVKELE